MFAFWVRVEIARQSKRKACVLRKQPPFSYPVSIEIRTNFDGEWRPAQRF